MSWGDEMLPYLKAGNARSEQYAVAFYGLNWSENFRDGEFSACENLSAHRFPCLSQRFARSVEGSYPDPAGLLTKEGLVVVHGTSVVCRGKTVGTVTPGRKQLAAVGRYVVIFPDKACYDVENDVFCSLEAECTVTGAVFTGDAITAEGVSFPFRVGDAVTVSGCAAAENNQTVIVRRVEEGVLGFYENTFAEATEGGSVTLKRSVPALDYICESNCRLWGTSGNTIYASRYGDPFNFQAFDGLAGDSYAMDVSTEGAFTGCIPYSGHICFFKENTLHKLYGSKPSNYQVVTSRVHGLQAGSERSLCVINETLFYKGAEGVYAYTGGIPELVSADFGTRRFDSACAATDGTRYYLSMRGTDGWHLLTYDVLRDLWLREDDLPCVAMTEHQGQVYLLAADGTLYRVDRDADGGDIPWSVTFCPFSETVKERKGYSRFWLRMELGAGSWLKVELRRDGAGTWETIHTTHNARARTVSIPVLPARCDSVEIRISGRGACLLRTFVREFHVGSDV